MSKTERIYVRTTSDTKQFLQGVANKYPEFKGEITAVIEFLIEKLREQEGA